MKKILITLLLLASFTTAFAHQVGDTVSSDQECYTLVKELGEGAFGKVFEAKDSKGQQFAIKWYKGKVETSNSLFDLLNDFTREFERGQLFDHPNIIKSYDTFSIASTSDQELEHYLILEFVPGKTVYSTEKRTISFDQSLIASEHLVEGLCHALDLGYLHLDLHLNNLMLDEAADAMIIDLASFFSWEELSDHANKKNSSATKKGLKAPQNTLRKKKLDKFFANNPKLLQVLQETHSLKTKGLPAEKEQIEKAKLLYHPYYFDRMTEAVVHIIAKSDFDKEKKLTMRAEVKKLSWSYKEDSEDGLTTVSSINNVLEELVLIIESYTNQT
jgi:serine/threonine protein kinase